jgi:hypothetical protein
MVQSRTSNVESQKKAASSRPTFDLRPWTFDLHSDERGSISFATVFAMLLLTMLLGMVINVGRQVDNKVKLQNAADATTYSGGVVLARGMNTLAFTNHMLCEVMALTAFFREARDRHAEPLVPEILAAWDEIGPILADSGFEKFDRLGRAIPQKTPLEQRMVTTYSEWMAASSEVCLPVCEAILNEEMIPVFQREVVLATPEMAQAAAAEIADRHTGNPSPRDQLRGRVTGVFWRTIVDPVGGASEGLQGTLPAVDPVADPSYQSTVRSRRDQLARHYLNQWNNVMLRPFDTQAKMSQFGSLWRGFTCGQLNEVTNENAARNFPHAIRRDSLANGQPSLEENYIFVGVVYRKKLEAAAASVFSDSLAMDNQAFAQGMLFCPRRRLVAYVLDNDGIEHALYNNAPAHWDLWNQNWNFQLVPAQSASIAAILSAQPQTPYSSGIAALGLPNLGAVSPDDVRRLTTH